jgi:transcription initiation factor TFIIIB Brf1 subunit/transcription initiation factor TFIIB
MDRLLNSTKIVPPVVLKQEPEVLEIKDVKEKTCVTCLVVKTVDDYYKNRHVCKKCCTKLEKKSYQDKTYQRLEKNGGSLRIPNKPGKFHDEYQRHYTYEILLSMGWSLNEENNKWWKDGIKTKDGLFINLKKPLPTKHNTKYYTVEEKLEKVIIIREEKSKGKTYVEIGQIINLSPPTVCKWLKEYEKK